MSRTVPAVTEDHILTIGPRSHVMCVRRQDGEFLWGLNVEKEYEAQIPSGTPVNAPSSTKEKRS
jgi:outer membrane protein assembly factor BamB